MKKGYFGMGEFSKLSGVPITTLRYWDSLGVLPPAKRTPDSGFRYYEPMQIITARFVSVMSMLGVPLQEIGRIRGNRSPQELIDLIARQERQVDGELTRLRDVYSIMHLRLDLVNYGKNVHERLQNSEEFADMPFMVQQRPSNAYILGPRNAFKEGEDFYEPFMKFCQQSDDLRVNLGFSVAGYHDDMDAFIKAPGQPGCFASLDPTGNHKLEPGDYLSGFCYNYYGHFDDLADKMAAYAKEHSLLPTGPVFTIYLHDEFCVEDPSQYLVEAVVRVKKNKKQR